jgi:hypothetical protein
VEEEFCEVPTCYNMLQILLNHSDSFGLPRRAVVRGERIPTIKRYLVKLLVGAAIGAMLGALSAWLVLGHSMVIVAILGALVLAPLGTLYDPNVVVHSHPTSRGETSPYNRRDD